MDYCIHACQSTYNTQMQLKNDYVHLQEFLFNCITFSHELGRKLQEEDKLTFPLFKQECVS